MTPSQWFATLTVINDKNSLNAHTHVLLDGWMEG